jgi:NAD(P)H-dependent FMN reductase
MDEPAATSRRSDEPIHITAICGSQREGSVTRLALKRALEEAERGDAVTDLIDLRDIELPVFNSNINRAEAGNAEELTQRVRDSDAILLGSPMYHGSYSSPLKTALDFCGFDEFEGKTVGLLAVSGGAFPVTTLEHMRSVCRALNAWVIPHQAAVGNSYEAIEDGRFVDPVTEDRIATLGQRVVEYARIEPDSELVETYETVEAVDH